MNYLALDLETTGLDSETTSVIEIGMIHYNGREKLSEFNVKIKPDFAKKISLGALKVNKVKFSDFIVNPEYKNPGDAAQALMDYFTNTLMPSLGNKEIKVLGHNVAFDVKGLQAFLALFNVTNWGELFSYSMVDTSTIGNFLREAGHVQVDKLSLQTLAEFLKVDVQKDKLHTALYDAELSAQCYFKMIDLMRKQNG